MYFPYFRGRQYDLLALKELAQSKRINTNVIPVVEPIKISSTFKATLQVYADLELPMAIIANPAVGDFADADTKPLISYISESVIPAVILNDYAQETVENLKSVGFERNNVLAVLNSRDFIDEYKILFSDTAPKYTLFPDERQMRRAVKQKKVLFEDKFKKQNKNADYSKNPDEFFSDDHLFYKDENYCGFGDYSINGDKFEEGGFSPRAVAIHIVYFDNDNALRVHHFVSDSNYGTEDVAGKFYEAVLKLKKWYTNGQERQLTYALKTLLEYCDKGYYPGLPTVKKLSCIILSW